MSGLKKDRKIILKVDSIDIPNQTDEVIGKLRKLNKLIQKHHDAQQLENKLAECKARIRQLQLKGRETSKAAQAGEKQSASDDNDNDNETEIINKNCLCLLQKNAVKQCPKKNNTETTDAKECSA